MSVQQALIKAYQQACEVELQAFKPGNVSVYSPAHDMNVEDFILSAKVSADSVSNPAYTLGEKIYYAIKATRQAVGCNTNLGIILLAAPLMQAYWQREAGQSLRDSLMVVLANTTLQDAEWAFKAITLAAPGGLGKSEQQDVNQAPEVTLLEAMQIASPKDRIALQYTNGFKDIFDFAVLQYNDRFILSGDCNWSALSVFAELLAKFPDSHIERKFGSQYSQWIATEMTVLCEALNNAQTLDELMPMLYRIDQAFKTKRINPGTTADLTVATLLVVFLEKLI
ncbi:MAG: triphosphoribosyl-dephospho-CoA synthase [Methylomonas sp.]